MQNLRVFCAVAQHRSFSAAAQELGITQSAASQRIDKLERELDVTLIDRSVRPLALTAAGEVLLRGGRELISGYDALLQHVAGLQPEQLTGTVHIEAIYSAGIGLLEQVKEAFEARHPRVTIVLDFDRPEGVMAKVGSGRCDLGIVSYARSTSELGMIPLRNEIMGITCAPGHPLAGRSRVHASELGGYRMAGFEKTLPVCKQIRKYLRENGVPADFRFSTVFDNIDTLKTAVAVTDQIAILPRRTVAREVEAGTLALVDLEPGLVRPIGIIYDRRRGRSGEAFPPVVKDFMNFLLEQAGQNVDLMDVPSARSGELVGGHL